MSASTETHLRAASSVPGHLVGAPGAVPVKQGLLHKHRLAHNWRIVGILFLITAEAVLYGFSYPFFTIVLEGRGLPTWLIGLNASFAGLGILLVGPFLPRLVDLFGIRRLVAGLFLLALASLAALLILDSTVMWFASRFVMGACFSALWVTTEIWLNGTVDDARRGSIVGFSATLYAGAQFLGPLLLSATGAYGPAPIVAAMVPLAAAAVVALMLRQPREPMTERAGSGGAKLHIAITFAGSLIAISCLAGIAETSMQSLLPVVGLSFGLSDAQAAQLVALFSLGEAVLVGTLGLLADRFQRWRLLRLSAIPAVTIAVLLPLVADHLWLLAPVLLFTGGTISGMYTLGVVLIGQDFRGSNLAAVSTGFAMAYSAGAVLGSTIIGLLIDLFGSQALLISISVSFLALAALASFYRPKIPRGTSPADA